MSKIIEILDNISCINKQLGFIVNQKRIQREDIREVRTKLVDIYDKIEQLKNKT